MRTDDVSAADIRGTRVVVYGLLGEQPFEADGAYARTLVPFRTLGNASAVELLFRIELDLVGSRKKLFSVEHPGELAWQAHLALSRGLELAGKLAGRIQKFSGRDEETLAPGNALVASHTEFGRLDRTLADPTPAGPGRCHP